jgi:hypothetical protein
MADERSDTEHLDDFSWEDRSDYRDVGQRPFADAEYRYSWLEVEEESPAVSSPTYHNNEFLEDRPSDTFLNSPHESSTSTLSWITPEGDPWAAGEYEPWQPTERRLSLYEEPQSAFDAQFTTTTKFELEQKVDEHSSGLTSASAYETSPDPYSSPVFPSGIDEDALRRFSPQINADTPGRAIGIEEGIWHFADEEALDTPGTIEENTTNTDLVSPQENVHSTWETLRRVAILGLRPGEYLVDLPPLVELESNGSAIGSARTPLVSTFEEVRQVLATMDTLTETPPWDDTTHSSVAFSEIVETSHPYDAFSPSEDVVEPKDSYLANEEASTSDENILAFPRRATPQDDAIDQHPFFTTMELKNLAFDKAGTLDTDLDKVSRRLQKKAWSRGQDDVVVKGRFGRQRGSHRPK